MDINKLKDIEDKIQQAKLLKHNNKDKAVINAEAEEVVINAEATGKAGTMTAWMEMKDQLKTPFNHCLQI